MDTAEITLLRQIKQAAQNALDARRRHNEEDRALQKIIDMHAELIEKRLQMLRVKTDVIDFQQEGEACR